MQHERNGREIRVHTYADGTLPVCRDSVSKTVGQYRTRCRTYTIITVPCTTIAQQEHIMARSRTQNRISFQHSHATPGSLVRDLRMSRCVNLYQMFVTNKLVSSCLSGGHDEESVNRASSLLPSLRSCPLQITVLYHGRTWLRMCTVHFG